ncbi:hypothetical protein J3E73DRAFT_222669 [Bipolaris maydis]|nr:hypothetical protein J3E73DRAFT_222669 [Bipolaris maydis]
MFNLQRQKVLDECVWKPGEGHLRYIEARTFANTVDAPTSETFQEGDLSDLDVDDWLHQRGRFIRSTNSPKGKEEGNIRLLICERFGFQPLQFGLSKASLLAIEDKFGLPIEMLPLFKFNGGGHSYYFCGSTSHDQKPEQLVITIKVPQMYQVANYGLCLTHSFKTHVTFGFMFGWNMFSDKQWKEQMSIMERPRYLELHGPRISKLIRSAISDWRHPLLLPVILLEDYVYHADKYKGSDLSRRTTKMEKQLGVTVAGRNSGSLSPLDFGALNLNMAPEKRLRTITEINTLATDAAAFAGNLEWTKRYCQFLRDISKNIQGFTESTQGSKPRLENTIETLSILAISILEHTQAIKARLDIQFNVLYNMVAQMDSNLNATIAATTGLDSVAMKALAFVTTLFLPPTFIATLFSMSMFDWQAEIKAKSSDSNEETKVLSRHFWIYWVASVPLTVAVLLAWRIWWHWEKNRYQHKYPHIKLGSKLQDADSSFSNGLNKMMLRRRDKLEDIEIN